ncbi:MAG TPA: hypothetical protein VFA75_09030 [Nevskia sp.]|nr:hypothetical protein [Nevskia sp.]
MKDYDGNERSEAEIRKACDEGRLLTVWRRRPGSPMAYLGFVVDGRHRRQGHVWTEAASHLDLGMVFGGS